MDSTSHNQREALINDSFKKARIMKSLAIIGMMFLSMGLFAQHSDRVDVKVKEPVCLKKGDVSKHCCTKMKLAPMQRVDARKSTLRTGNVNKIQKPGSINSKRVHVQRQQMVVPLRKESVVVDKKM